MFLAPRTRPSRLEAKLKRFLRPETATPETTTGPKAQNAPPEPTTPSEAMSFLRDLRQVPAPLTEDNLGDLTGKVYIITGATAGIGRELADILYSKNATVYVGARSEDRAQTAVAAIRAAHPASRGRLALLLLDLADLATIPPAVTQFLTAEKALHSLFNNAGVMFPPAGSVTPQGYELQLGTNCLGPFLLTALLTALLAQTAKASAPDAPDTVRVVWVSSSGAEALSAPQNGGFSIDNLDYHDPKSTYYQYGVSKAGNFYHATEFARRHGLGKDGIVSVALHPGLLNSDLARHKPLMKWLLRPVLHPPRKGAHTVLFAGFGPDVTAARVQTDNWIVPWGAFRAIRADMQAAAKPAAEGGGLAEAFWAWSEEQVKPYM